MESGLRYGCGKYDYGVAVGLRQGGAGATAAGSAGACLLYTSHTLVQLAVQQRKFSCPVAFGNNSTKQRIAHVLRYKKQALWITGVALAIIVMMAVALGVNPVPTYRLGELQPELAERAVDQAYIQWGCVQVEITEPAKVQALSLIHI